MNKYYELNKDLDNCTIILSSLGYGKSFYEIKRLYEGKIKDLQKKAELGEHYKHLYSEVKKQKDEIFKYIKSFEYYIPEDDKNELLRMLGEIK